MLTNVCCSSEKVSQVEMINHIRTRCDKFDVEVPAYGIVWRVRSSKHLLHFVNRRSYFHLSTIYLILCYWNINFSLLFVKAKGFVTMHNGCLRQLEYTARRFHDGIKIYYNSINFILIYNLIFLYIKIPANYKL
jgi:hypothetical protein